MVNDQNAGSQDQDIKLEEEILVPVHDEEVKAKVIEKYGLDEIDNASLIDKLVEEEKEFSKKLSTAISQKRKWREQAQAQAQNVQKKEETPQPEQKLTQTSSLPVEEVAKLVEDKLNERDLASMDISDTLKSEVKAYAKAKSISYREASNSPYLLYMKEKEEEQRRSEEASVSSKGKSTRAKREFSTLSDDDVRNLDSDGFKDYNKWLKTQK